MIAFWLCFAKITSMELKMTTITLKGTPTNTVGSLPKIGTQAPAFTFTKTDLSETALTDYLGKNIVLNIFPSVDTPTCSNSVRKFNSLANGLNNTTVLCVSADLPFAQKRFCGAENLDKVIPVSVFRHVEFGKNYGVTIIDGPLQGLLSRAIVILDEKGKVIYTQQVNEIAEEPDYDDAMDALNKAVHS
jgi:thiol peroxidase